MTSSTPLSRNDTGLSQFSNSSDRRSSSLGSRLFRSKSREQLGERKSSSNLLHKKRTNTEDDRMTGSPPQLPSYTPQPSSFQSFGGESPSNRLGSNGYSHEHSDVPAVPAIPAHIERPVDQFARTESMTHRGRYSYANSTISTIGSPRRVRRRKDPTPYNVLVIGGRNSGKTSFLNLLKKDLALPAKKQPVKSTDNGSPPPSARLHRNFVHHYQEVEIDNERIGLTLWDSQGLEKGIVDIQLREVSGFVESKFDDTFIEETKVVRATGVRDTHIHCVFLILDPVQLDFNLRMSTENQVNGAQQSRFQKPVRIVGVLDEDFELQIFRTLQGKTAIIPVISKADTITTTHMAFLKKCVCESLKKAGLNPLEALDFESDDDSSDNGKNDDHDDKRDGASGFESAPTSPKSDVASDEDASAINTKRFSSTRRPQSMNLTSDSLLNGIGLPFSIISPDHWSLESGDGPIGRAFPWGFADPYNLQHCDFVRLKESCFRDWRGEFRLSSREIFYERWRTTRLNDRATSVSSARQTPEPARRRSGAGIPIVLEKRKPTK